MISEEQPQGITHWLKESITVKLVCIGVLVLLLLIPSAWINNLITERAGRQDQMVADLAKTWSASQMINGPVLIIPYRRNYQETVSGKETTKTVTENLYLLPNELNITSGVNSEKLKRGIFSAVVYNSKINISGNFAKADLEKLSLMPEQLMPEKARIAFSISDLKGLKINPIIKAAGQTLNVEPDVNGSVFDNGLQSVINLTGLIDKTIPFNFSLDLKGSQELSFIPLGKTTTVRMSGNWPSPSFDGRYIPDSRSITPKGFTANWRMLYYNRPYPQQWTVTDTLLRSEKKQSEAAFGVKFIVPADQYQQTLRTSKYSILIILLTFVSLFLTELIGKYRIHAFNYILIGAAMVIYYTLLLSLSEQIGYAFAYLVASVATIGLVSAFIASLLKNTKAAAMFAFILALFYTFIYIIIQLEDYALLMGSIALFIIVGTLMYFSRKINWDRTQ